MRIDVDYLGGAQLEVTARNHKLLCDQPVENGGFDEGVTPPELMLASLGTCAAYYAAQYLKSRKLPTELRVHVEAEKAKSPARLSDFVIQIDTPGVDRSHEKGILRAVEACLIHNTLLHPPKIETRVVTAELAAA